MPWFCRATEFDLRGYWRKTTHYYLCGGGVTSDPKRVRARFSKPDMVRLKFKGLEKKSLLLFVTVFVSRLQRVE